MYVWMVEWLDGWRIEKKEKNRKRERKRRFRFRFVRDYFRVCVFILSYFRRESDADADEDAKKEKDVP